MVQQAQPDLGAPQTKTAQHRFRPGKPKPAQPPKVEQFKPLHRVVGFEEPSVSQPAKRSRLANPSSCLSSGALAQHLAQQPATVGPPLLFPEKRRVGRPAPAAAQMPLTTVQPVQPKQLSTSSTATVEDTRDVSASPVLLTFADANLASLPTSYSASCAAAPPASPGPIFPTTPHATRAPCLPPYHQNDADIFSDLALADSPAARSPWQPSTSQSSPAHPAGPHQPAASGWQQDSSHGLPLPASGQASSPAGTHRTAAGSAPPPAEVASTTLAAAVDESMPLIRRQSPQQLTDSLAAASAGPPSPVTPVRQDTVATASPTPFDACSPAAPTLQHTSFPRLSPNSPLCAPPTTTSPHRTYQIPSLPPYSPNPATSSFAPLAHLADTPPAISPINVRLVTPVASYHRWSEVGSPHLYRPPPQPSPRPSKEPVDEYDALKRAPPLLDHDRRLFCEAMPLYKGLSKASLEALYTLWEPNRLPNGEYRGINHNKAIADICNIKKAQDRARQLRHGHVPTPRQRADPRTRWWHGRHDGGFAEALSCRAPSDDAVAARTGSAASRVLTSVVGAAWKLFGR